MKRLRLPLVKMQMFRYTLDLLLCRRETAARLLLLLLPQLLLLLHGMLLRLSKEGNVNISCVLLLMVLLLLLLQMLLLQTLLQLRLV